MDVNGKTTLMASATTGHEVGADGFSIVGPVIGPAEREQLISALGPSPIAGRRGLLGSAAVAALARSDRLHALIRPHFAVEPFPVRAIYFDKSPDSNWLVAWHQDLTIAARAQANVPNFGPWSVKDGISHVQPPVELLERMLTVRLHLDDADASNGALRVLPGSHRFGRLSATQIQEMRTDRLEYLAAVPACRSISDATAAASCVESFDERAASARIAH